MYTVYTTTEACMYIEYVHIEYGRHYDRLACISILHERDPPVRQEMIHAALITSGSTVRHMQLLASIGGIVSCLFLAGVCSSFYSLNSVANCSWPFCWGPACGQG